MKPLRQLFLRYCAPEWGRVALLLLLALAAVGLEAMLPWPVKILVDHVLPGKPLPAALSGWPPLQAGAAAALGWIVAAMLALFLLHHVLQLLRNVLQAQLATRMQMRLAGDVLAHLESLSPLYHARAREGDLVRRVTADTDSVPTLLTGVLIPLVASVAGLVVLFSIMWRLDAQLALVAGFVALPMVVLMKVFGGELHEENRFRGVADRTLRAYLRTVATQLQFRFGVDGCEALGTALVLVLGGLKVLGGTLTVGTLVVFLSYLAALYAPLLGFACLSSTLAGAAGGARRVLEVLECDERVHERPGAPALRPIVAGWDGHIRFEGVHFGYRAGAPVLKDISLEIKPGEVVALVGASGAGKSTLAAMIPRLIDPDRGRILIDGQDLRDVSLASLRQQVSLVLQDPFLLPVSIAQNIRLGRHDATDQELADAARMAHAAEFIGRLPPGYDTMIGERGVTLSGGQRQRLAIARALVRNAPILVLDEPNSALDLVSEQRVLDAMDRLMHGRTTLIIAHRLSTMARADRILVLEDGRIAESGTHDQLLAAGGLFYRLWLKQTMAGRTSAAREPTLAQPS